MHIHVIHIHNIYIVLLSKVKLGNSWCLATSMTEVEGAKAAKPGILEEIHSKTE